MRRFALLLALAGASAGEETTDLQRPLASGKARQLREQAQTAWTPLQPLWDKIRTKKEVTAAEAVTALPVLEQIVDLFERSLREEWDAETNRKLADAARAWCKLRPLVPPPEPPTDEAQKKKAEKAAEALKLARVQDIREFVTKYAAERRPESQFHACTRCDGRGEIQSSFGDRVDCPACKKRCRVLDREGLIAARWIRYSPLHRAATRNEQAMNRLLRSNPPDAQRDPFAPYARTVLIKSVEDRDFWARVKTQEQVQPLALSKKTEKSDGVYILIRIGTVWYLYDIDTDRELLDLTAEIAPPADSNQR